MDRIALGELPARFRLLDAFRGIACFLVVLTHAFTLPQDLLSQTGFWADLARRLDRVALHLWIGVPIFFVISGYCIAAAAEAHARRQRPIGEFFSNRLRRIYLPYLVAVALTAALVAALDWALVGRSLTEVGIPHPADLSLANWFGNLTLTEGLLSGLPGHQVQYQILPAWTLCHEIQFYFISGVLLLAAGKRFLLVAGAFTVLGAAIVPLAARFGFQLPPGCVLRGTWLMFAMGLVVYWQAAAGTRRARWIATMLLGVPLVWSLYHWQSLIAVQSNNPQNIFIAAVTALALVALHPVDAALARRPIVNALARLGTISFSVYLTHCFVIRCCDLERSIWLGPDVRWGLAVLVASIFAAIAFGAVFYRLVETRSLGPSARRRARQADAEVVYFRVSQGEPNLPPAALESTARWQVTPPVRVANEIKPSQS